MVVQEGIVLLLYLIDSTHLTLVVALPQTKLALHSHHSKVLVVVALLNPLCYFCRYDPSTGIYGMDFFVVLERPGYRVARRRRCKSRVGIQHRVTKEDAMKWFQVKYEGVILNKSQTTTG
ncbi:hypothetical protein GW17_00032616 [Ensete ventricosum]|nr:hypothetical protein GW17_00032616 [Ensete ventricosum]